MKTRFFSTTFLIALMMTATLTAVANDNPKPVTTIILLKHAETVDTNAENPSLSDLGKRRAELLSDLLRSTPINAIYACKHERTNGTLKPLSEAKGIKLQQYNSAELNKSLFNMYSGNMGNTIVICGDDKTLPQMLNMLTGTKDYTNLSKEEFDNVFVLTSSQLGKADVKKVKYATNL
jgi:2,3-bisphosphoglycerate-dependent phosphoglycerate mutase